jgi:hypothetical protein
MTELTTTNKITDIQNMEKTQSPDNNQSNLDKYMSQLSHIEKKAFFIAQEHLGSSFNILKSNGYLDWLKSQSKK